MSLLFFDTDLDANAIDTLSAAYGAACDELTEQHGIDAKQLARLIDPMVSALSDLYSAGQRNEQRLQRYVVARTLVIMRIHPGLMLTAAKGAIIAGENVKYKLDDRH